MKGMDFLEKFNGLAEDIVLEAQNPERYKKQKLPRGNIVKFAGVAAVVAVLVGVVAAGRLGLINTDMGNSIIRSSRLNTMAECQVLDIRPYTELQVVTDRKNFTPVTQDQSYNPETDMNRNIDRNMDSFMADAGETVYIAKPEGDLFAFQKENGTAAPACDKADCGHIIKAGGDCEANLRVLDARVEGMQYYKGDLYYSLGNYTSSILFKMSADTKEKQKYVSLLGEKGYGNGDWMIHRGYIYFEVDGDGFYRMPVDNPNQKERLIDLQEGSITIRAYGSYVYFIISRSKCIAVGRYNTESGQIEQFTDITGDIHNFVVNDGRIYFTEYAADWSCSVFCYNINTGEKERFLLKDIEKQGMNFSISFADSDYIYIERTGYVMDGIGRKIETKDYAYTWDGVFAGEIPSTKGTSYAGEVKPFQVFHWEGDSWIGSDSDRLYYLGEIYDTQANEYGTNEKLVEGTGKTVISYINKSELSADSGDLEKHIAGEIDYREEK